MKVLHPKALTHVIARSAGGRRYTFAPVPHDSGRNAQHSAHLQAARAMGPRLPPVAMTAARKSASRHTLGGRLVPPGLHAARALVMHLARRGSAMYGRGLGPEDRPLTSSHGTELARRTMATAFAPNYGHAGAIPQPAMSHMVDRVHMSPGGWLAGHSNASRLHGVSLVSNGSSRMGGAYGAHFSAQIGGPLLAPRRSGGRIRRVRHL